MHRANNAVFLIKLKTKIMDLLTPGLGLFFWTLIAFLIVFYILAKFAWKPILKTLNERETGIANALSSAEKMKAEMANIKNENEQLLAKANEERTIMLKEARETADKLISDAKNKAKQEFDKIIADAQEAIQQQKNAAIIEVKNQAGVIVVDIAEKILQRELQHKADQNKFIESLTEQIHFK